MPYRAGLYPRVKCLFIHNNATRNPRVSLNSSVSAAGRVHDKIPNTFETHRTRCFTNEFLNSSIQKFLSLAAYEIHPRKNLNKNILSRYFRFKSLGLQSELSSSRKYVTSASRNLIVRPEVTYTPRGRRFGHEESRVSTGNEVTRGKTSVPPED